MKLLPMQLPLLLYRRVKGGQLKSRTWRESPFCLNAIKFYNQSSIGKFSNHISLRSHEISLFWFTKLAHSFRLFKVRRSMQLFFTIFGCASAGYYHASIGNNLLVVGYQAGFVQASDYSGTFMDALGRDEKIKY